MFAQCPYCGGEIQVSFSVCKFCNGNLTYGSLEAIRQASIMHPELLVDASLREKFIAEVKKIDESREAERLRNQIVAKEEQEKLELAKQRKEQEIQEQALRDKQIAQEKAQEKARRLSEMGAVRKFAYTRWYLLALLAGLVVALPLVATEIKTTEAENAVYETYMSQVSELEEKYCEIAVPIVEGEYPEGAKVTTLPGYGDSVFFEDEKLFGIIDLLGEITSIQAKAAGEGVALTSNISNIHYEIFDSGVYAGDYYATVAATPWFMKPSEVEAKIKDFKTMCVQVNEANS